MISPRRRETHFEKLQRVSHRETLIVERRTLGSQLILQYFFPLKIRVTSAENRCFFGAGRRLVGVGGGATRRSVELDGERSTLPELVSQCRVVVVL